MLLGKQQRHYLARLSVCASRPSIMVEVNDHMSNPIQGLQVTTTLSSIVEAAGAVVVSHNSLTPARNIASSFLNFHIVGNSSFCSSSTNISPSSQTDVYPLPPHPLSLPPPSNRHSRFALLPPLLPSSPRSLRRSSAINALHRFRETNHRSLSLSLIIHLS